MPLTTPNLEDLPVRMNRRDAAAFVSRYYFPVHHRTLERAPLIWRHVNGYALVETGDLIAWASAKVEAAAPIRGGRRPASPVTGLAA